MAAKTPTTLAGLRAGTDTGYVDPKTGLGDLAGTKVNSFVGLEHRKWYFSDLDTADTWTSGIDGLEHVAFKATSSGTVDADITTIATGLITFTCSAANQTGILHTWSRA